MIGARLPKEDTLRVTFVTPNMNGGGAQRVLSHMANYWAAKGWSLAVVTLLQRDSHYAYHLDRRVECFDLVHLSGAYKPLFKKFFKVLR